MRIAILSDIHGNLDALEAVTRDVDQQAPDEIWCGGDISILLVHGTPRSPFDAPMPEAAASEFKISDLTLRHRRVPFDKRPGLERARALGSPLFARWADAMDAS